MKNPLSAEGLDTTTDVTNYNYGQLKDATDDTSQDGTVIDKNLLADIRTVFMRAVRLTGIPINNIFDTENSSQLFDACFGTTKVPITTFHNGVTGGSTGAYRDPVMIWKENGGKTLRIEGWIKQGTTGTNDALFSIPADYNSTKEHYIAAHGDNIDHPSGTLLYNGILGIVTTIAKISGTLNDVNHYINASIPLD